ncbi:PLP-dependent aminotransferase family protein [Allorhizobium undicola]|uniref:MocR-like pyridoxine biosynthesis transcription factor PdxR n=1 Tax=Allorhizobium undicola TaxID=78527 RepID=UPI003D340966
MSPFSKIEADISGIVLDRQGPVPLSLQLTNALRALILSGSLASGVRLPASRRLAQTLGISRNAVNDAFTLLNAECLIEVRQGSGTYVAHRHDRQSANPSMSSVELLSVRSQQLMAQSPRWMLASPDAVLAPGIPALHYFPANRWNKSVLRASRASTKSAWSQQDPRGYLPLRQAIAAQIGPSRGVFTSPEHIIVLSSAREAFQMSAMLLLEDGATAAVEDPCLPELVATLTLTGNHVRGCPTDEEGIETAALESLTERENIRLVFTTPTHQYPSGAELSPQRRSSLLALAEKYNFYIIEDDYDGEFRSSVKRQQSLFRQDTDRRVIYVGTFSKSIAPSLRLAFMVSPPELAEAFVALKTLRDGSVSLPLQFAVHDFIASGNFTRHLVEMRQLYRMQQLALAEELTALLGGIMSINTDGDGLHLVGHLPFKFLDRNISAAAAKRGIGATALSSYCLQRQDLNGLVMGFAGWDVRKLKDAAGTIANLIRTGL